LTKLPVTELASVTRFCKKVAFVTDFHPVSPFALSFAAYLPELPVK
jgi:hypothetical protein